MTCYVRFVTRKYAVVSIANFPLWNSNGNSSMIIRDLTLRSAASFGSFHLVRLLYDEYMFHLVEHRVAMATGEFFNLKRRSKEEDDASIPSPGSGSLHVGITASVTGSKANHLPIVQLDGNTSTKRPKLSWCETSFFPTTTNIRSTFRSLYLCHFRYLVSVLFFFRPSLSPFFYICLHFSIFFYTSHTRIWKDV